MDNKFKCLFFITLIAFIILSIYSYSTISRQNQYMADDTETMKSLINKLVELDADVTIYDIEY